MICEKCQKEVEAFIPQSQTCHACGQAKRRETLLRRSAEMTEKECVQCHKVKPIDAFFRDKRMTGRGGRNSSCKECQGKNRRKWTKDNAEYQKEYNQAYYKQNATHQKVSRYGLTVEEYAALLTAQNGVCKICGGVSKDGRALAIDHHHQTGKVRGLLCTNCNRGIGYLQDDVAVLRSAIQYLEETKT